MTNNSVYETQKLIIPAKINTNEPRRVSTMLREIANQVDEVTPEATKKPKQFLADYLKLVSTLRQLAEAAEDRTIRDWASIGGNKSEIQRITGKSYGTVDRRSKVDAEEQERNYRSVIDRAERTVSGAREEAVTEPIRAEKKTEPKAAAKKPPKSGSPYKAQDYAEV